jgi:hypothetical protein
VVDIRWKLVAITIGTALLTFFIQLLLKHMSRPFLPGRKTSITADDWVVWSDWAVLGGLSFMLSLIAYAHHPTEVFPIGAMIWCVVFLLLQLGLFPVILKAFAYEVDPENRTIKIKNSAWVVVCDVVGGLLLASVVQSGISIYDWTGNGL